MDEGGGMIAGLLNKPFIVWIVIAVLGLLVLRFILKVTKKLLTLVFMVFFAIVIYLLITRYLVPGGGILP